ncbi:MAG: hypothetical protein LBN10_01050 [Propionibacteriaceae bacterium]|nr:hypothetical protein [Propionibacteriaceae bacterium]
MRKTLRGLVVALAAVFFLAGTPTAFATPPLLDPQAGYQELASDFLVRNLQAHDGLAVDGEGQPAYATTTYAIAALVAAGYNLDQAKASAQALLGTGEAFIGPPEEVGAKATAIALTVLSLRLTDLDPTTFPVPAGTRDLIADLTSAIHDDGSIGDWASAYGQGYALMALAAGGDSIPDKAIDWLVAQPCADTASPGFGGFGFSPGSCEDVDPDSTALAVLGLLQANAQAKAGTTIDNAAAYLASIQDSSGGFVSPMAGVNANTTGLVVSALNASIRALVVPASSANLDKARAFVLSLTYRCGGPADTLGAIAYDKATFSTPIAQLDAATESALVASTAQGMTGLYYAVVGQHGVEQSDGGNVCSFMGESNSSGNASHGTETNPSQSATPSDQASDAGQSNTSDLIGGIPAWAWIAGSLVLLVIVVAGGVLIVRSRRQ